MAEREPSRSPDEAEPRTLADEVEAAEDAARGCLGRLVDAIRRHVVQTAIAVVLAFAVGVPWLVKANLVIDPNGFEQVAADAVPEPARVAFERLEGALLPLGYERWGWVRGDTTPGSVTFLGVLAHADERAWGTVLSTPTPVPGEDGSTAFEHSQTAFEIVTPLGDGRRVATSNIAWPKSFAGHDGAVEYRHPEIDEPLELRRLHLAERRAADAAPAALGSAGDLVAIAREQMALELEAQVAAGLLRRDETTGLYEPTWKGAFWMTYPQIVDVLFSAADAPSAPGG